MNSELRAIRFKRNLSQWTLAKESGVQQSRISLYENKLIDLNENEKKAIADVLRIPIKKIFPDRDTEDAK